MRILHQVRPDDEESLAYTLHETFRPTVGKVIASGILTIISHYLVLSASMRGSVVDGLEGAQRFWTWNFANALPYLNTTNRTLKFIIFFALSYIVVSLFGKLFNVLDRAQLALVRHLRKNV